MRSVTCAQTWHFGSRWRRSRDRRRSLALMCGPIGASSR
jgi:hypothetical protein